MKPEQLLALGGCGEPAALPHLLSLLRRESHEINPQVAHTSLGEGLSRFHPGAATGARHRGRTRVCDDAAVNGTSRTLSTGKRSRALHCHRFTRGHTPQKRGSPEPPAERAPVPSRLPGRGAARAAAPRPAPGGARPPGAAAGDARGAGGTLPAAPRDRARRGGGSAVPPGLGCPPPPPLPPAPGGGRGACAAAAALHS